MKSVTTILALALLLILAVAPAGAQPNDGALRIGDVLTIGLPGEATFNKDFPVDRKGAVTLPEAGVVRVAGHSLDAATVMIRDALSHAYRDLDRLSVTLKERKLPLTVLGYVKTPGDVEVAGDANVQTALVAAGGISQGAQLDRMTITHADGKREQFDYKKYLDSGDPSTLPRLQPLDVIFVPASPLTGNVQIDFDGRTLAADRRRRRGADRDQDLRRGEHACHLRLPEGRDGHRHDHAGRRRHAITRRRSRSASSTRASLSSSTSRPTSTPATSPSCRMSSRERQSLCRGRSSRSEAAS